MCTDYKDPTKLREGTYDLPNLHAVFPSPTPAPRDALQSYQPMESTDKFERLEREAAHLHEGMRGGIATATAQTQTIQPKQRPKSASAKTLFKSAKKKESNHNGKPAPLVKSSKSLLTGLSSLNADLVPSRPQTPVRMKPFPTKPSQQPKLTREELNRSVERLSAIDKKLPPIVAPLEKDFLGNIIPPTPKRPKSASAKNSERIIGLTEDYVKKYADKDKLENFLANGWKPNSHPGSTFNPSFLPRSSTVSNDANADKVIDVLPITAIVRWPELYRFQDNQHGVVCLTIEHCCDCEHHTGTLHHRSGKYLAVAESAHRAVASAAAWYGCKLHVYLKPNRVWIMPHEEGANPSKVALRKAKHLATLPTLPNDILGVKCENRLGALEVQISANW